MLQQAAPRGLRPHRAPQADRAEEVHRQHRHRQPQHRPEHGQRPAEHRQQHRRHRVGQQVPVAAAHDAPQLAADQLLDGQRRQQQRLPRLPLALAGDGAGAADADDQAGQHASPATLWTRKPTAGRPASSARQPWPAASCTTAREHVADAVARRQRRRRGWPATPATVSAAMRVMPSHCGTRRSAGTGASPSTWRSCQRTGSSSTGTRSAPHQRRRRRGRSLSSSRMYAGRSRHAASARQTPRQAAPGQQRPASSCRPASRQLDGRPRPPGRGQQRRPG